jgi:hypothetical protein
MKQLLIGLTCLLVSAILYGSTLIAAAIYSRLLSEPDGLGWSSQYGIFGTAMRDVGIVPLVLAALVGVTGIVLIAMDLRNHMQGAKK